MNETLKSIFAQLVPIMLAGGLGGWIGVQVTLAELRANVANTEQHVHALEAIAHQHADFRERIARLEAIVDQECK